MFSPNERAKIIALINREVVPAIGCTEPIAVALCTARAAELLDALKNFFRLQLQIFLIVKSDLCHVLPRISKFQQTACEKTKHAAIILS